MRYIDRDNLPWKYDSEAHCIDGRLRYVCDTGGLARGGKVLLNEVDAKSAVEAVNYHDRLVSLVRDALEMENEFETPWDKDARALLKEIRGES